MDTTIPVIKKAGVVESFSEEKVLRSMRRVGLPSSIQPHVMQYIKERLYPNITTKEIFSFILEFLKERDRSSSLRFNLKQALLDLGPTGFPFEQYMAHVFESMGFTAKTNLNLYGECVNHEIDLLIEKDGKRAIVEAKFHNQPGHKTDLQVALYTYARYLDVAKKHDIDGVWLVTNTHLSLDAIAYGKCKSMQLIGWNYPENGNLQELIESPALYPITILTALSDDDKRRLLEENVVLCRDLITRDTSSVRNLVGSHERFDEAKHDAALICKL
jgi:hypothetical protein